MDEPDEVGHGEEHAPWAPARWVGSRWDRSPRAVRAGVVAVIVVVVGALVWHGAHPTPRHAGTQPTDSAARASPLLLAEEVCTTFVGTTLEVTFRLSNIGQQPVQVAAVRPELPLGMLLALGAEIDNGHCGSGPGSDTGTGRRTLAAGASMPVTFRLLPLVECAQPAPVQAAIDVAGPTPQATVTVPVLADLGSVNFPGCTTAVASAPRP